MARGRYAPVSVVKRRWWLVQFPGQDWDDYVLAETRSKARYRRWLDIHDAWDGVKIQQLRVLATDRLPVYERVKLPPPPRPAFRTMTHADWLAEARRRFGPDPKNWAWVCPSCHEEQTMQDFIDAGMTKEDAMGRAYFSCIGRVVKGRGCDWSLGGLLQMHTLEVVDQEGKTRPVFEFEEALDTAALPL